MEGASAAGVAAQDPRPLVVHVMYRFDTGGLENGVVNLINHMPPEAYRHAVLALTEVTGFRERVRRADVQFHALGKPPGHTLWVYPRLVGLLRRLRPAIVHTRNLAALEVAPAAWAAGVPVRIHGEHGRDVGDLDGSNRKYQLVRRLYRPFVTHQIALSADLEDYLRQRVGVPARRVSRFCNGVDGERFAPAAGPARAAVPECPFEPGRHWLVGTVGRMQAVKDQTTLARAFVQALATEPALRDRLRLVLVGDGPLLAEAGRILTEAGVRDLAWLPGERSDVPAVMRLLDVFVLPSLAEGISNTILEAMASGLPVLATRVGGNAELVEEGATGLLVPPADPAAMAAALRQLAGDPARAAAMGRAGRARVDRQFSMQVMVDSYRGLYDRLLRARTHRVGASMASQA